GQMRRDFGDRVLRRSIGECERQHELIGAVAVHGRRVTKGSQNLIHCFIRDALRRVAARAKCEEQDGDWILVHPHSQNGSGTAFPGFFTYIDAEIVLFHAETSAAGLAPSNVFRQTGDGTEAAEAKSGGLLKLDSGYLIARLYVRFHLPTTARIESRVNHA